MKCELQIGGITRDRRKTYWGCSDERVPALFFFTNLVFLVILFSHGASQSRGALEADLTGKFFFFSFFISSERDGEQTFTLFYKLFIRRSGSYDKEEKPTNHEKEDDARPDPLI